MNDARTLFVCDQSPALSTNSYVCDHCVLKTGGKHKPLCTLDEYLGVGTGEIVTAVVVWREVSFWDRVFDQLMEDEYLMSAPARARAERGLS